MMPSAWLGPDGRVKLVNGEDIPHAAVLKIIIVGGGIGGLTAAIALREQGHSIDVGSNFISKQEANTCA